jgi:hypothetical protein
MTSIFLQAAERLGLTHDKQGVLGLPFVHGELEGQHVRCSWGDRATRVDALLEPGLDLGLDVQGRNFVLVPTFGRKIVLGDSNWDDELSATADEPQRAAVLFAGDARGSVLKLNAQSWGFEIKDHHVTAFAQQYDVDGLVHAFQQVARVASQMDAARKAVPPASGLTQHAAALRAFGRKHQLGVEETPLHVWGQFKGVRLEARFVRTGKDTFDLQAGASPVEATLGSGLLVRRETAMDRARTFFGGQDLRTGDKVFDPAFLVQAQEAERALAALDGDVRALLLELRARFEAVKLEDGGLLLRGPATKVGAEALEGILESACTVVESVARANASVQKGPYR